MLLRKSGRIINIVGMGGRGPNKRYLTGGPINAAVLSLTKSLANNYGPDGILVTALSPGPIDTGHHENILNWMAQESGMSFAQARNNFLNGVPVRRYGTPDEVANTIAFLASDKASYILSCFDVAIRLVKKKNSQKPWETLVISENLTWEQFSKINFFLHDLEGAKPVLSVVRDYPYKDNYTHICLLYTSPSPRDGLLSRMPSSA